MIARIIETSLFQSINISIAAPLSALPPSIFSRLTDAYNNA